MGGIMCDKRQLSYTYFANMRGPMPLSRKLRLMLANNLRKIRRMKGCCGNYGQARMLTARVGAAGRRP